MTFLRVASGAAEDLGESEYLLGDWNSRRTRLEEQGLKLEVVSTTEFVHNAAGGLTHGTKVLENVDVSAELDTEKLQWWDGGKFFFYYLIDAGGKPSPIIGDLQTSSNIEAPDTSKPYEAWHEQHFGEVISLLVGLHDYNSGFYTTE